MEKLEKPEPLKVHCRFVLEYKDSETAEKIKNSLEVDNQRFITTEQDGNKLIAELTAESLMSLLHTTEDYLSCLTAAESVIAQTEKELNK
jgi:tRNA threonylcarbamoyladenosine modification (KEOPS) complex  Pcc1 subunit